MLNTLRTLRPVIVTYACCIMALLMVPLLLSAKSCDTGGIWDEVKPVLTKAAIDAVVTAKSDPAVRAAIADGDFELAGKLGLRAAKTTLRNTATTWAGTGGAQQKAYELVRDEWPIVGAMISRPDGEGLYWRLDRWLAGRGHASISETGILGIELSAAEFDELWPLALLAVEEEYLAARAWLNEAAVVDTSSGIDTGGEW